MTDSAGNAVNRYVYDPYGNALTGTVQAVVNPWQFVGGYKDGFSGFIKFGARYYDPAVGRWTQSDPSGQDENTYMYAGGNPVNFTDRAGLKVSKMFVEWTAFGVGAFAGFGCWATITGGTWGTLSAPAVVGCAAVASAVTAGVKAVGNERFTKGDLAEAARDFVKNAACDLTLGRRDPFSCAIMDVPKPKK